MFSELRQFHLPLISIATHAKEKIQPNVDSHKSCNYKEKCNFDLGNYLGFLFVPTQIRIEFLLHSLLQKHRYLENLRYSGAPCVFWETVSPVKKRILTKKNCASRIVDFLLIILLQFVKSRLGSEWELPFPFLELIPILIHEWEWELSYFQFVNGNGN